MSVLTPALLGACGLVLLASALSHLRDPAALRTGLAAHGVLPRGLHAPVVALLGPLEAVLGGAALVVALTGPSGPVVWLVSMPLALLFLLLTVYLSRVARATAGQVVPCACGLGEAPVGPSAVLRGGILTGLAVIAAVSTNGWALTTAPAPEILVAVAAMLVLATAVALLPAARAVPEPALHHADHHGQGHR